MITLKTLHQASAQEVFDQVATHLLTQKVRSMGTTICVYRNPQGLKCAAGCLIADDEYTPAMEGASWESLSDYYQIDRKHIDLVARLQFIHDRKEPDDWFDQLIGCADTFKLNSDVVEKFA